MTLNLRAWIHFFNLRCAPSAHPQMIEVATMIRDEFVKMLPEVFGE
jgi:thymidylate synthase (FAD)